MDYKKITEAAEIYNYLLLFEVCFPHLKEKVDYLEFSKKLAENAEVYVAFENNEPIGITCFYANDSVNFCGYITLIGVITGRQKSGFGQKIIDFTFRAMQGKGMKSVKLEVDKDNLNAKGFYEHIGFHQVGETGRTFYLLKEI